jgi:opacity protein-like surface antigen
MNKKILLLPALMLAANPVRASSFYSGLSFGTADAGIKGDKYREKSNSPFFKSVFIGSSIDAADIMNTQEEDDPLPSRLRIRGDVGYMNLDLGHKESDLNIYGMTANIYAGYTFAHYFVPYAGLGFGLFKQRFNDGLGSRSRSGSKYVPQYMVGIDVAFSKFAIGFEYTHMNASFNYYDPAAADEYSRRTKVDAVLTKIRIGG